MNVISNAVSQVRGHWFQGEYGDGQGNFCGVGHLYSVNTDLSLEDIMNDPDEALAQRNPGLYEDLLAATKILNKVAVERFPERTTEFFVDFNDHPETTENDVISVMVAAALVLEESLTNV